MSREGPAHRHVPTVCWTVVGLYAAYYGVELSSGIEWSQPSDAVSGLVMLLVCLLPVLGLAWLTLATRGAMRAVSCAALVLGAGGGAWLVFHALHVAPPDAQSALIIVVVAAGQIILLTALAAVALVARLLRRRRNRV